MADRESGSPRARGKAWFGFVAACIVSWRWEMDPGYTSLAKLSRPRLHRPLQRERLFALLERRKRNPATWVSGPPGSGKTTLVASFLEARRLRAHWYQVDVGDRDPATWFYYLTELAKQASGTKAPPLPYLTPEYLADLPGFTRRFFRQFLHALAPGSVLVLDNCHDGGGQEFNGLLREAIGEVPLDRHLIAISRQELPPELLRHAAAGAVTVVGWEELRLTRDEATAIATAHGVAPDTLPLLERIADGWAAGLTLLTANVRRGGSIGCLGDLHSKEAVFDYFASELFDRVEPQVRELLMRTALFPQFSVQVAQAVSGDQGAGETLEYLHRHHYFTDRRMADEVVYRYHDLFREFLLARLARAHAPHRLRALHAHAARILLEAGELDAAIHACQQAQDWRLLSELVCANAAHMLASGRWQTVRRLICEIGADHVQCNAWLLYWLGVAQIPQDQSAAEHSLQQAFARFSDTGDLVGQILAAGAVIESRYYAMSDWGPMEPWLDLVDRLLVEHERDLPRPVMLRAYPPLVAAMMMLRPDHPRLLLHLERAVAVVKEAQPGDQRVAGAGLLLNVLNLHGFLDHAAALIERVGSELDRAALSPLTAAFWQAHVGLHRYLSGSVAQGLEACEAGIRLGEESGLGALMQLARTYLGVILMSQHKFRDAAELIEAMRRKIISQRDNDVAQLHLLACWLAAATGNTGLVGTEARSALAAAERVHSPFYLMLWSMVTASALAEAGELEQAETLLGEARRQGLGSRYDNFGAVLELVGARVAYLNGDTRRCAERLAAGLAAARTQNGAAYLQWMVPPSLSELLAFALREGIDADYARGLARLLQVPPPAHSTPSWPWPLKLNTLGTFEIRLDDKPVALSRKAPKKLLALLKCLVAQGPRKVPEGALAAMLWPDEEGDAANERLKIAIHRLRRLLGEHELLRVQGGQIGLDLQRVWVDAWECGRTLHDIETGQHDADPLAAARRLLHLYRGQFLAEDEEEPWLLPAREHLRTRFVRAVDRLAARCRHAGRIEEAADLYLRGIEVDGLAESLYQGLMRCYEELNRPAEGMKVFRSLRQALSVILGRPPTPDSQALYERLSTL